MTALLRFVLHRHSSDTPHFDLMLEMTPGAPLATYRIGIDSLDALTTRLPVMAERIADHRQKYLDFEGDLGRSRGSIAIVDRGLLVISRDGRLTIKGEILQGDLVFSETPEGMTLLTLGENHPTEGP